MLITEKKSEKIKKLEGSNYKMPMYTYLDVVIGFFQKLLYKFHKQNYVILLNIRKCHNFIKY